MLIVLNEKISYARHRLGNIQIHRYRTRGGVPILALLYLTRLRLFGRPQSEAVIQALFE